MTKETVTKLNFCDGFFFEITDGLNNLNLKYNYLNLVSEVKQNSTTKAIYKWSSDGVKLEVREPGFSGGGFQYVGSLIYKYVSGQLQLESGSFSNGRIVGIYNYINGGIMLWVKRWK